MYKREFKGTADGEVSYGTAQSKMGTKGTIAAIAGAAAAGAVGGFMFVDDLFPNTLETVQGAGDHYSDMDAFVEQYNTDMADLNDKVDAIQDKVDLAATKENISDLDAKMDTEHIKLENKINGVDGKVDEVLDRIEGGGTVTPTPDPTPGPTTGGDITLGSGPVSTELGIYLDNEYGGDFWVSLSKDGHGDVARFDMWNRDGNLPNAFVQDLDEFEDYFEGRYGGDWDYESTISQVTFSKDD